MGPQGQQNTHNEAQADVASLLPLTHGQDGSVRT